MKPRRDGRHERQDRQRLPRQVPPIRGKSHRRQHRQSKCASRHSHACAALARRSGEQHGHHQELNRHERQAERVVHRQGLHRHGRDAVGTVAAERKQRPLRTGRAPHGTPTRTARRSTSSRASAARSDRVFSEPGEEHWHGAAPTRFMTHLAMLEVDDEGNPATWVTTSATRSTRRGRRSTTEAPSSPTGCASTFGCKGQRMEPLWSPVVATGGNQRQIA
jgi:hypothetical protein